MTQGSSPTQNAPVPIEIIQEGELTVSELDEVLDILANHLLSRIPQDEPKQDRVDQERIVE